jgi:hypothetical protein
MPKLRSLSEVDSSTLERYRRDPVAFIEENLVSPYNGERYRLVEAERVFIQQAFKLDSDGRLLYPLLVYGAIKKSRKTELAELITIAMIVLFGGKFAQGFVCANSQDQAISLCFTGCKLILEASPLFRNEVRFLQGRIFFTATQSSITAIANSASSLAGVHPTISVHDEAWAAPPGERGRAVFDQLIPVPSRKISCRLVVSHAGVADPNLLLYQLYLRGLAQPKIGTDLYAGDGLLMHWSHEPLHPWQDERWLREMQRELSPVKYSYMIENRFVADAASFITDEMFDRSVRVAPRPTKSLVIFIGVDAAPLRDHTAVVAVCINGDCIQLVYYRVFTPTPDTPLDFEEFIEGTLLKLAKQYTIRLCLVDPREMSYLNQRLKKKKIPIEELTQTPLHLGAAHQMLYDLFRSDRFITPTWIDAGSIAYLRNVITRVIFTEKSGGLRFAEHQSVNVDLAAALAMACLAATRHSDKSGYRLDVFSEDFRDEDLPPLPEPELPTPPQANADWWKSKPRAQPTSSADERLRNMYGALDNAIRWGLIK